MVEKLRGEFKLVPIDDVQPNLYNYNEMSAAQIERERKSLEQFGVVRAVIVRQAAVPGKYIIVDGEHRWKILKEAGAEFCPIRDLGIVSEAEARALTVALDEIRGQSDYVKLSELFASIKAYTPEQMAELLPYDVSEITAMVEATEYDWSEFDFTEPSASMVSEYGTIVCRVTQEDAELIERKAGKLCEEMGFKSDKEAIQLGHLFEYLLENNFRQKGGEGV